MRSIIETKVHRRDGFDSAVAARDQDHLNRWPFAREIYEVATNGPKDWSVRVGVYGEWGTGKTSVLKFIETLSQKDHHVVVWFDPWEYSSPIKLWDDFVLKVLGAIEAKVGGIGAAGDIRKKIWLKRGTENLPKLVATWKKDAGKATETGLDFVRRFLTVRTAEFEAVRKELGNRRILILFDDLDRTAAKLLPEILFAVKELMDVPGFAFICAFDPVVVGAVLGQHHPGFGDGLKFLDKIIDYPRWLPPPPTDGLLKLALEDRRHYTNFVPEQAIRDSLHLLPANPRSVRQFIRILALLRPQIERHYESELRWPVIVASTALKVQFPQIAYPILEDEKFWGQWSFATLGVRKNENDEAEREKLIKAQIEAITKGRGIKLEQEQENTVSKLVRTICNAQGPVLMLDRDAAFYQLHVAETPAAVTQKEFDELVKIWELGEKSETITGWMAEHAERVGRSATEVHCETLDSSVRKYAEVLDRAESALPMAEPLKLLTKAAEFFRLVQCLALNLSDLTSSEKKIGTKQLHLLFNTFSTIANSNRPFPREFHARNKTLLLQLIERWQGDVDSLMEVVKPYDTFSPHMFERESAGVLKQELSTALLPKFAEQLLRSFRQPDFARQIFGEEQRVLGAHQMLLNSSGPFWTTLLPEIIKALNDAKDNLTLQENAYQFLYWCGSIMETGNANRVEMLLRNKEISNSFWKAATATRLSPGAAARLNGVAIELDRLDAGIAFPIWWKDAIKESGFGNATGNPDVDRNGPEQE